MIVRSAPNADVLIITFGALMSEKKSFIVIAVILVALIVGVYHYSVPKSHMHLAPVVGDNIEKSLPAKDTAAKTDSSKAK